MTLSAVTNRLGNLVFAFWVAYEPFIDNHSPPIKEVLSLQYKMMMSPARLRVKSPTENPATANQQ
jgi:hypothetical protein